MSSALFRRTSTSFLAAVVTVALCSPPALADEAKRASTSRDADTVQGCVDALAEFVRSGGGRLSASVVAVEDGRRIGGHSERTPVNPASNMKVITAAAALEILGPQYVYTTGLYGTSKDGSVESLVLRGHGDPSLSTSDLLRLARALATGGVERVGRVLVDQSRFDDAYVPPAFDQQPNEWAAFRAPVSAVSLEQNTVTLNVVPADPGKPARAWFEPPGFVEISGKVDTSAPGRGQNVGLTLERRSPRLGARLGGHVAAGMSRLRFKRRVDDPRLYPGYVLSALLTESGVRVAGPVELGGPDERSLLSFIESAPLSVLLRELGKSSDNFYAETIFKTLGAETAGTPANSAHGAAAVLAWLRTIGAEDPGTKILNGSGLFDANRISAHTLTAVLVYAYRNPKIGPDFVSQLAIGGVDGTLRSHFRDEQTRFIVRAKTGTLNRTISLAGYVLARGGGPPIAFAFLVDGLAGKHAELRQRIDGCVSRLTGATSVR